MEMEGNIASPEDNGTRDLPRRHHIRTQEAHPTCHRSGRNKPWRSGACATIGRNNHFCREGQNFNPEHGHHFPNRKTEVGQGSLCRTHLPRSHSGPRDNTPSPSTPHMAEDSLGRDLNRSMRTGGKTPVQESILQRCGMTIPSRMVRYRAGSNLMDRLYARQEGRETAWGNLGTPDLQSSQSSVDVDIIVSDAHCTRQGSRSVR